jgi:hypothetical protein
MTSIFTWFQKNSSISFWAISLALIVLGAGFRLKGMNWDQRAMLHPDERFIVYVVDSIRWITPGDYFNTAKSGLNPHNVGHELYVYGTFPLMLIKAITDLTGHAGKYGGLMPGRWLATTADLVTLVFTMLFAFTLFGRLAAVMAGALSACCVLQIQLAHFGTFDSLGTCLIALTLWILALIAKRNSNQAVWRLCLAAGATSALAASTKINLALVLAWLPLALLLRSRSFRGLAFNSLGALAAAFLTFRLAQPYAFQGPGFFDLTLNEKLLENFRQLRMLLQPSVMFPPSVQWLAREGTFALKNLVLWGLGGPPGVYVLLSWGIGVCWLIIKRDWRPFIPVTFALAGYLVFGFFYPAPTMRYQAPYYPALFALSGGVFAGLYGGLIANPTGRLRALRLLLLAFCSVSLCFAPVWALAFTQIYNRKHPRVEALYWALQRFAGASPRPKVLYETIWDDAMPFWLKEMAPYRGSFPEIGRLEPYERDTPAKAQRFADLLAQADLLMITSNRQWGSLGRLPQLYPLTNRFYALLADCSSAAAVLPCYRNAGEREQAGALGYRLIKTFSSYPQLGPLIINDQAAEEAFTVYDHPKVLLFQNERRFDADTIYHILQQSSPPAAGPRNPINPEIPNRN